MPVVVVEDSSIIITIIGIKNIETTNVYIKVVQK